MKIARVLRALEPKVLGAEQGPALDFRQVVESARDIVIVTRAEPIDPPGPEIVYVNRAFTALTGYAPHEVIGRSPRMLQGPATGVEALRLMQRRLRARKPVRATVLNYAKNGRPYWLDIDIVPLRDAAGTVTHFAAIQRDVTADVEARAALERLALTDALTGLGNRRSFQEQLRRELARARRHRTACAVALLDLDRFKSINDAFGHRAGDEVLRVVADCIRDAMRADDFAARLGGEEFALLMPGADLERGFAAAERLRQAIAVRLPAATGAGAGVTASIGVAAMRPGDRAPEAVLDRADRAMYRAKGVGRNRTVAAP